MGYTIGIHAKSEKLCQQMADFFEREYRPYGQVWGLKDRTECYTSPPIRDASERGLSYLHGKSVIGIDYGAVVGFERSHPRLKKKLCGPLLVEMKRLDKVWESR